MNDFEIKKINEERKALLNSVDLFHAEFAKEIGKIDFKNNECKKIKKPLKIKLKEFIRKILNTLT